MMKTFARAWRAYRTEQERSALANRLGTHLARDIGIEGMQVRRVLPTLRTH